MNKFKTLLISVIALTAIVLCVGCSGKQQADDSSKGAASEKAAQESTSDSAETGQVAEDEHAYDVVIETAYGDLYFPDQWQEFLVTDQTEEDDAITVSFSAEINGETYSLFTVTIGGDEENSAGTLTASDGTQRNVYVQIDEIQESDLLNEGEQNRLYAMQEDINYLLDSLE